MVWEALMGPRINETLKRSMPWFHSFLKRRSVAWRLGSAPIVPVWRRIRGEFFWVHPRLFTSNTHDSEPHIERWILDHLCPGGVLFDVGAHYGWLSLKATRHVGPIGRVVAFEPSPVLLEILRYHQHRNRLAQMMVVGNAVSDREALRETLYLLNEGLSSRNSLTIGRPDLPYLDPAGKTAVEVSTVTLDGFCDRAGIAPDVIKIDVEGAEGMVLRGAAGILRQHRPVLVISTHPYWFPSSESTERLFDLLAGHGYQTRDAHVIRLDGYEVGDYLLTV
jgi:FkbM family methyltransferase